MDKMNESDGYESLAAYKRGARADMVQMKQNGSWGVIYTITPNSLDAMQRAVRQITHTRPEAVRYTRLARLRNRTSKEIARRIVLQTQLPGRHQQAWDLATSQEVKLHVCLSDGLLDMLETAFRP